MQHINCENKGAQQWQQTGINTVSGRYEIVKRTETELFARITVSLDWERTKVAINYTGNYY